MLAKMVCYNPDCPEYEVDKQGRCKGHIFTGAYMPGDPGWIEGTCNLCGTRTQEWSGTNGNTINEFMKDK